MNWFHVKNENIQINLDTIWKIDWEAKKSICYKDPRPCTALYPVGGQTIAHYIHDPNDRLELRKLLVGDDWQPDKSLETSDR